MSKKIFVNLPVKNLQKSISFFTRLGYTFNPQFTDDKATCMIISEHIYAMLVTKDFFKTFTKKEIADASRYTETIIALSVDSRAQVDDIIAKAIEAGGTAPMEALDHGFMYQHGYQDLDGHLWEILYLDPSAPAKS